jgi:uncharacterized protein
MPDMPFPPGEPIRLRDDEERWFAPVFDIADSVVPAPNQRHWDPAPWREVEWVGFVAPAASPHAPDPAAIEAEASDLSTTSTTPAAAKDAAWPAIDDDDQPLPASKQLRRPGAGIGRLLRLAAGFAALGLVAVVLYHGGERLAGLAGATPPPAVVSSAPAMATEDQSITTVAVPIDTGPATAVSGPAAGYLDRARAGDPIAQYDIAVLYARGDGLPRDDSEAATWFREAALAGNLAAAFNLGVMYERGLGVTQNMGEAVAWYRRAAAGDFAAAAYNLAIAYAEGSGTPQDWAAAAQWYHRAALLGVVPAMVNFAIAYEKGEGVEASAAHAYAWYRAAARRGDVVAAQRAAQLFRRFTGTQKVQAVTLAAALVTALHEPGAASAHQSAGTVGKASGVRAAKPGNRIGGASLDVGRPGPPQPPG